jgi:single-stranded DNA-binding protein
MNVSNISGRLVRAFILNEYPSATGTTVIAQGTLAVDRKVAAGKERKADFITFKIYNNAAQWAAGINSQDGLPNVPVGSICNVSGSLRTDNYTNKAGEQAEFTYINSNDFERVTRYFKNNIVEPQDEVEEFDHNETPDPGVQGLAQEGDNDTSASAPGVRGKRNTKKNQGTPSDEELTAAFSK